MTPAAIIAISIGAIYLVFAGLLFGFREPVTAAIRAFPRNKVAAWVLAAIAMAWFGFLLWSTNFGRFERLRPLSYVAIPGGYYCLVKYLDELLSVRALGGLFILAGAPLLDAIRWHDSPWRLAITVLVYLMIVKGMVLVVSPYRFRHGIEWMFKNGREKIVIGLSGALGIFFVAIGLAAL